MIHRPLTRCLPLSLLLLSCAPAVEVDASISAVSLADDCEAPAAADIAGACPIDDPCPSFCQQSSMQLQVRFEGEALDTTMEIGRVWLLDESGTRVLDELDAKSPKVWMDDQYQTWDEQLAVPSELKVLYNLSAPAWHEMDGVTRTSVFRLRVELIVDGDTHTLTSDELMREPEIVT